MKRRMTKILGIIALAAVAFIYMNTKETLSMKALKMNMTGNAQLRFSKTSYNLGFQKLSTTDEAVIDSELKKIHQIQEKITSTSISNNGEIMITLAKSIDQNIVLVVFKNQQIQMIQKVTNMSENKIDFQYGSIDFQAQDLENEKIAYSQNVELEF
jgi:hypothetical protein